MLAPVSLSSLLPFSSSSSFFFGWLKAAEIHFLRVPMAKHQHVDTAASPLEALGEILFLPFPSFWWLFAFLGLGIYHSNFCPFFTLPSPLLYVSLLFVSIWTLIIGFRVHLDHHVILNLITSTKTLF